MRPPHPEVDGDEPCWIEVKLAAAAAWHRGCDFRLVRNAHSVGLYDADGCIYASTIVDDGSGTFTLEKACGVLAAALPRLRLPSERPARPALSQRSRELAACLVSYALCNLDDLNEAFEFSDRPDMILVGGVDVPPFTRGDVAQLSRELGIAE